MKKAVAWYERIAGAKVNFDQSEGLRLGAWTGSDKGRGRGVLCVYLPLDPLLIVCTSSAKGSSAGASTISHQITLGRAKADGP